MIPLVTIVGFLGAGKTTFLKEIIPLLNKQGIKTHVVINDFQNARVDATYFKDMTETVVPINGSCVCCGSFEELVGVLEGLEAKEDSIVFLESNGVTDSITLIENLSLRKECQKYTKPLQISIVDTKSWQKRHWHNTLELEQISTASFLYLSKIKKTPESRVDSVLEELRIQAPYAQIMELEAITNELIEVVNQGSKEETPQDTSEEKGSEKDGHTHTHNHTHNHDKYHFNSWEVALPRSVAQSSFYKKLNALPEEVIRAKGIVRIKDLSNQKFIFQKVDDEILVTPISEVHELEPLLICIGSKLPVDKLEILFA